MDYESYKFEDQWLKELKEQETSLRNYIAAGSCKNYEEYSNVCGKLHMLCFVRDRFLDLAHKVKND